MRLKNGRQTVVLKTAAPLPKVLIQKAVRMREPTGARVSPNPMPPAQVTANKASVSPVAERVRGSQCGTGIDAARRICEIAAAIPAVKAFGEEQCHQWTCPVASRVKKRSASVASGDPGATSSRWSPLAMVKAEIDT